MRSIRAVAAVAVLATAALATGIGAALATGDGERSGKLATAVIHNTAGDRVGVAVFKERQGKVIVTARVWGLVPGFHGAHVHEVGQCVPPPSAGGHLTTRDDPGPFHGDHAGDVPSLLVNGDGTGQLQFATDRFGFDHVFDANGSAFIVHGGRDNYANIPTRYIHGMTGVPGPDEVTRETGDAGERVACGVIEQVGRDGDDDD
jgi:superoxide dismutase, Cu-Zn family